MIVYQIMYETFIDENNELFRDWRNNLCKLSFERSDKSIIFLSK